MREEAREIRQALLDRLRAENARAPKSVERAALEAELETAGIDTTEFGLFHDFGLTTFDYEAAAPILVEWLPRVREPADTEVIARSLTGTKSAAALAARALTAAFRGLPPEQDSVKWAIGNALATLADAGVADDLLELLRDSRHGYSRQLLCDALKRTKDPRAANALIEAIDDDDIAGHAILALRSYGPKSALPHLRRARPKLEAVLARPTATVFAKRQARKALERLHA
jgi:HEAT repeat protein